MGEPLDIWKKEIVPRLDLGRLLSDLNPRQTGDNLYVRCPQCGNHDAFIKLGHDTIGCNRANSCGAHISILAHLNGGSMPQGREWIELIKRLGKEVGVDLPERNWTPEQIAKFEQKKIEADILTRIHAVCKEALAPDLTACYYLVKRGFIDTKISEMEFGLFDRDKVANCATTVELEPLGLNADAWHGRIIFPLRDYTGVIRAIVGRDTTGNADKKYIKTTGFSPDELVLEGLDQARKYKNIIAGESSIAVFSFREAGHPEFTGAGGSNINAKRWEALQKLGIQSVTICFDNDKAGREGTLKSCEEALTLTERPDIYVIDPAIWGEHNDPDAFLFKRGKEETNLALATAVSLNAYLARAYAAEHDLLTDRGRTQYLDRCAKYLGQITDERQSLDAWENFFKRGVQELTKVDEDFFFDYVCQQREEWREKKLREKLLEAQAVLRDACNEGDIIRARDTIASIAQDLHVATMSETRRPLVKASERLAAHDNVLRETRGKKSLGLRQFTLPTLDQCTLGLRLLNAFLAGPGAGKTTLVMQLLMDILTNNLDTCALVVSLEMQEDELLTRMKSRAIGVSYDRLNLANDDAMLDRANTAISGIADRMFIIDTDVYPEITVDLIIKEAARAKEETGCEHVVIVIDYLQRFPIPASLKAAMKGDLDEDKWRTKQMIRLRKAFRPDPIMVISQINKVNSFRATGLESAKGSVDFVFDCDNVFLINQIPDEELIDRIDLAGTQFATKRRASRYKRKTNKEKLSDEDAEKAFNMFTEEMERQGKAFVDFTVEKVRGGKRKSFVLVHNHLCSDLKELTEYGEAAGARMDS